MSWIYSLSQCKIKPPRHEEQSANGFTINAKDFSLLDAS